MKLYYDNDDYDAQLKRTLGAAYSGAADLGEALVAASRAKAGDADSWFSEWSAAAGRAEAHSARQGRTDLRSRAAAQS